MKTAQTAPTTTPDAGLLSGASPSAEPTRRRHWGKRRTILIRSTANWANSGQLASPSLMGGASDGADARENQTVELLISVIIPCYNDAHFLGDAISSVNKSEHDDVEIIIVDDGSVDDAGDVARSFSRTKYVRQENGGLATARNRGLQESRGRFLVFLDADDMLAPGALDIGVSALAAYARAAMVYGRCRSMASDGTIQSTPHQERIERDHYRELLKRNYIWMPAMAMFRREALERAGGFDPSVNAAADYGVYLRVARTHPLHDHGRVVAYYRKHDDNMSGNAGLMLQESLTVLRRERPFAEHDASLLAAYYEGWKSWQDYYGAQLVNEIRSHARGRQWTRVLRKSARLAWLHPGGFWEQALRKISTSLRGSLNT